MLLVFDCSMMSLPTPFQCPNRSSSLFACQSCVRCVTFSFIIIIIFLKPLKSFVVTSHTGNLVFMLCFFPSTWSGSWPWLACRFRLTLSGVWMTGSSCVSLSEMISCLICRLLRSGEAAKPDYCLDFISLFMGWSPRQARCHWLVFCCFYLWLAERALLIDWLESIKMWYIRQGWVWILSTLVRSLIVGGSVFNVYVCLPVCRVTSQKVGLSTSSEWSWSCRLWEWQKTISLRSAKKMT